MSYNKKNQWDYENGFMLTCDTERLGKHLNQWELFKRIPKGDIVEVGVFKGASLSRLAMFRDLLHHQGRVYGFDTFANFPPSKHDQKFIDDFLKQAGEGIEADELRDLLAGKGLKDIHLVEGDIFDTLPLWLSTRRKLALVNIDVDAYEPTKFAIQMLKPHLVNGGIMLFDDYSHCEGAKRAIREVLTSEPLRCDYYKAPYYIVNQ